DCINEIIALHEEKVAPLRKIRDLELKVKELELNHAVALSESKSENKLLKEKIENLKVDHKREGMIFKNVIFALLVYSFLYTFRYEISSFVFDSDSELSVDRILAVVSIFSGVASFYFQKAIDSFRVRA
ncbi:TPA: hypothetical protein ACF31V_003745, partial [Vibrio parahaemolyticus]